MVKQNCEKIANFRAELTLTIGPKTKKKKLKSSEPTVLPKVKHFREGEI